MLLQETAESICDTPLFKYNPADSEWQMQPQLCRLAAYDRFISDRAFGQKKRVLTTPGTMPELTEGYYRVGTGLSGPVFMWESENTDMDSHGPYLRSYMVRHLRYQLNVLVQQVIETLPTGQQLKQLVPAAQTHWCDLDFYSSSQSESLEIQHPQFELITAPFMALPMDCVVQVTSGDQVKKYRVTERYEVLHSNHYRVVFHNG